MKESKGEMQKRHAKEKKNLEEKVKQMLKKAPKADKKKTQQQAKEMEEELKMRHKKEVEELIKQQEQEVNNDDDDDETTKGNHQESNEVKKASKEKGQEEAEEEKIKKQKEKQARKEEKKRKKLLEQKANAEKEIEDLRKQGAILREEELKSLQAKVLPLKKKIKIIEADGHCLYRAVSDQLSLTKKFADLYSDFWKVRKIIADTMRENRDEFIYFLETPSGDIMTEKEYKIYCDKVEKSAEWGGQIELKALVGALKICIIIYQAFDAPIITMGEEYKDNQSIYLSYHKHFYTLGEHYNSIVQKHDDNDDDNNNI